MRVRRAVRMRWAKRGDEPEAHATLRWTRVPWSQLISNTARVDIELPAMAGVDR